MQRTIFHIDLDAFFASVEQNYDKALKNKPVIVAGKSRKSVVSSANYLARSYGVKAAEPVFLALKKCPEAVVIPCDFNKYIKVSEQFIKLIKHKVSRIVEVVSIDECYVDVTDQVVSQASALEYAKYVQKIIKDYLNIGVSIGISSNKFLAKLATDMHKPEGITVIFPHDVKQKVWPLPIGKMIGVGQSTEKLLLKQNIKTIGDLANYHNVYELQELLGNNAYGLYKNALGEGDDYVNYKKESVKSISISRTNPSDICTYAEAKFLIYELAQELYYRIKKQNVYYKTIYLGIKNQDLILHSKQKTVNDYFLSLDGLIVEAIRLFETLWNHQPIRLLAIGVSELKPKNEIFVANQLFAPKQTNHHHDKPKPKTNQLEELTEEINKQFGYRVIKIASELKKK